MLQRNTMLDNIKMLLDDNKVFQLNNLDQVVHTKWLDSVIMKLSPSGKWWVAQEFLQQLEILNGGDGSKQVMSISADRAIPLDACPDDVLFCINVCLNKDLNDLVIS